MNRLCRLAPAAKRIEDRIASEAMFSQGRLLFQRDRPDAALRYYQRAFRFSHGSQTVLDEIVQLAFRLGHLDEAARYALLAAPDTPLDPFVLRRLALHLTDRQQFDQAVRLYERTLSDSEDRQESSEAAVITRFEMGRLYFLSQQFDRAAQAFGQLLPLLPDSLEPPADAPAVQALLQDAPLTFAVMGEAFLRAGQLERAAQMFNRAYPTDEQAVAAGVPPGAHRRAGSTARRNLAAAGRLLSNPRPVHWGDPFPLAAVGIGAARPRPGTSGAAHRVARRR